MIRNIVDKVNQILLISHMKVSEIHVQQIRAFNRCYTNILGLLDNHLLKSEYSLAEGRILYEVSVGANVRASDIMNAMDIDKSYLSRLLKKMEKQGLIAKTPAQNDARATYIYLTPHGQGIFSKLNSASNKQVIELLSHLTRKKQVELTNHMNSIVNLLKSQQNEHGEKNNLK
jgi:DNA-binding MarR family transcriptional regulator